jgi:glyoxylase-like metal-dependent hydrolase (beta-lactamase superfamily II)
MHPLRIGDVTITSINERDGPWREPQNMFPTCDPVLAHQHLREMDPVVYDAASGRMVITYQTFVVRTPHHLILVDTCIGEHKEYPPPMDFNPRPWLDNFNAAGLRFDDIDYVFCTHLHIDHTGWNTLLTGGRWVPTFPNAKYVFHRREYEYWEAAAQRGDDPQGNLNRVWTMNCLPIVEAGQAILVDEDYSLDDTVYLSLTPGHSPYHCCVHIRSRGQEAIVVGDLMHHALQCREPDWSTRFCSDPLQAARTRRKFLGEVAGSDKLILPVHFPAPTAGRIEADGARFHYRFAG